MKNNSTTTIDTKTTKWHSYTFNSILLKIKYSFYSTIVFFIFANPETIIILQRFFGKFIQIVNIHGITTIGGLVFISGLFFITIFGLMLLPAIE